jgi:2-polyprenyl-3-methyl-5-hydroxy-6-metoxy-1,4-benzoquinol methylase
MRTNPRPTLETIDYYYPVDYSPYLGTRVNNESFSPTHSSLLKRIAKLFVEFNTNRLPPLPPGKMLEIGCASGAFLHLMALNGWKVSGIEYSSTAAENARALGYTVHQGSIETAPEPDHFYDLVVGWMVLEHLHDPLLSLKILHRWTKSRGWLVLSVPNIGGYEYKIFKDAWYALQVPTHLFFYTSRTLETVLARGGWRVEKLFHQRILNNLFPSIGYYLSDRGMEHPFTRALIDFPLSARRKNYYLYPVASLLAILGLTGRMTVWARRDD